MSDQLYGGERCHCGVLLTTSDVCHFCENQPCILCPPLVISPNLATVLALDISQILTRNPDWPDDVKAPLLARTAYLRSVARGERRTA